MKMPLSFGLSVLAITSGGLSEAQQQPGQQPVQADSGLQEIIVTATRRAENINDVPIAITSLSNADLKASGIEDMLDLGLSTPGLTASDQVGGLMVYIRGSGSSDVTAGQEQGVSVYVDGVYQVSPYTTNIPFSTVDHVEVLKGPQGTLFGRNSTGGLVNIITKDPEATPTLEARVSYGNYNTPEAELYGSAGVAANLASSLTVFFTDNLDGFGRNLTTGNDTYTSRDFSVRNKWMWTPADRTSLRFSFDYSGFGTADASQFLPGYFTDLGGVKYGNLGPGHFYDTTGNEDASVEGHTEGVSARLDQQLNYFDVAAISAFRATKVTQNIEYDYSPASLFQVNIDAYSYKTFTQELQILSRPESPVKWIGGLFFMKDASGIVGNPGLGIFGAYLPPGGVTETGLINTRSLAAYAEATVKIVDQTHLTLGGRYTSDHREISGVEGSYGLGTVYLSSTQSRTFTKPTYRAILDRELAQDVLIYTSYSRGFKSGNFNTTAASAPAYNPETVDAYELGLKAKLGIVQFNVAAYHNKVSNLQVLAVPAGGTVAEVINAAKARANGAEVGATARFSKYFQVATGASYLDSKYESFPNAPCYSASPEGSLVAATCNAAGNRTERSPPFTFNVTPTVSIPLAEGSIAVSASYMHSSKYYWDPADQNTQNPLNIFNGRLTWNTGHDGLSVSLWAKNIVNQKYESSVIVGGIGNYYFPAPPLTYGAEIGFKL